MADSSFYSIFEGIAGQKKHLAEIIVFAMEFQFKKYRKPLLEKRANVICANMDQHNDYDNDDNTPTGDDLICDDDDDDDDGFHFLSG